MWVAPSCGLLHSPLLDVCRTCSAPPFGPVPLDRFPWPHRLYCSRTGPRNYLHHVTHSAAKIYFPTVDSPFGWYIPLVTPPLPSARPVRTPGLSLFLLPSSFSSFAVNSSYRFIAPHPPLLPSTLLFATTRVSGTLHDSLSPHRPTSRRLGLALTPPAFPLVSPSIELASAPLLSLNHSIHLCTTASACRHPLEALVPVRAVLGRRGTSLQRPSIDR